jgi:hypothetical protein
MDAIFLTLLVSLAIVVPVMLTVAKGPVQQAVPVRVRRSRH